VNQTEYINIPLTDPISQAGAVIVALSYPGVAKTVENDSFRITVEKFSASDVREGKHKEHHAVHIDRFNSRCPVARASGGGYAREPYRVADSCDEMRRYKDMNARLLSRYWLPSQPL